MPKAVVDDEFNRYDLKSAPPDGYVMLKPMAYGDALERQGMALKMSTQMQQGNRAQRRSGQAQGGEIDFKLSNREVTLFEYQKCVGEHNLEDKTGTLLDLSSAQGIALLHPKIGAEIGELLNDINAFDSEGN